VRTHLVIEERAGPARLGEQAPPPGRRIRPLPRGFADALAVRIYARSPVISIMNSLESRRRRDGERIAGRDAILCRSI
jgi:hypothetical protein